MLFRSTLTIGNVTINLTDLANGDTATQARDKVLAALNTKESKQKFAEAGYKVKATINGGDKLDIIAVKTDGTNALGKGAALVQWVNNNVTPNDAIAVADGASGLDNTLLSIDGAKKTLTAANTDGVTTNANILFEVTNVNHDADIAADRAGSCQPVD